MPIGLVANLPGKYGDRGYQGAGGWWPLGVQGAMGHRAGAVCGWGPGAHAGAHAHAKPRAQVRMQNPNRAGIRSESKPAEADLIRIRTWPGGTDPNPNLARRGRSESEP